MCKYKWPGSAFLLLFIMSAGQAQNSTNSLHHNPFNKPQDLDLKLDLQTKAGLKTVTESGSLPKLQAVLLSENLPMVIADEVILSTGKEVNGYTLIKVIKNGAVFEKDKHIYNVKLKSIANKNELE